MLIRWIASLVVALIIFFIIGWITGTDEYGGVKTKDDERSQFIKQKAIVSSWLLLLMFFIINFVFNFFNLNDERIEQLKYPGLFYLLIAIISYFVYYWIYSRRMSGNEK